jgi:hypothetical protein
MIPVSILNPLARNIFYAPPTRDFQPVSLDEILDMLVHYEGPNERNDLFPNESERLEKDDP